MESANSSHIDFINDPSVSIIQDSKQDVHVNAYLPLKPNYIFHLGHDAVNMTATGLDLNESLKDEQDSDNAILQAFNNLLESQNQSHFHLYQDLNTSILDETRIAPGERQFLLNDNPAIFKNPDWNYESTVSEASVDVDNDNDNGYNDSSIPCSLDYSCEMDKFIKQNYLTPERFKRIPTLYDEHLNSDTSLEYSDYLFEQSTSQP